MLISLLPLATALAVAPTHAPTLIAEPAPITSMLSVKELLNEDRFKYEYVEAEIVLGDGTGFSVAGSYRLQDNWFLTGRVQFYEVDIGPVDPDLTSLSAGVTYVHSIQENFDVLGTAELDYINIDADGFGSDDDLGLLFRGGARYAFTEEWEAFGGVGFRTAFDDNEITLDLGGRYLINEDLEAQVSVDFGDDLTLVQLGVRYRF